MKKLIFLTLALLLPIGIFIFLKMFGRNEFEVPVLYQEGGIDAPSPCSLPYATPYRVPDSVVTRLSLNTGDSVYVLFFDPSVESAIHRVAVEFRFAPARILGPDSFPPSTDVPLLKECVFLMGPGVSAVLLDDRYRIRGYYDASDREEVDRLVVEMKIILKQF